MLNNKYYLRSKEIEHTLEHSLPVTEKNLNNTFCGRDQKGFGLYIYLLSF